MGLAFIGNLDLDLRGFMVLAKQTISFLQAARQLVQSMPADAVLVLAEKGVDWDELVRQLDGCRLLVAAADPELKQHLEARTDLTVLDLDPGPTPIQELL